MYLNKQKQTAILVFANSSQEEAKHKSIAFNSKLFDALTNNTLKVVEKSQLPYFHFSEKQQIGTTFGERFSNAIHAVFEKGYAHVITIGNDSPQLTASHILETQRQLQHGKTVLGPTTDGGFYLMGIHKSQFDVSTFTNLAWQTSNLAQQLKCLVTKQTDIALLERLIDIDNVKDVESIMAYGYYLSDNVLKLLLQLLGQSIEIDKTILAYSSFHSLRGFYNKGSPITLQA